MLTRGAQVTGVASCALCLTWISGAARLWVRIRIQKFFGIEDWLFVASMCLLTALCGLLLDVVNFGLGAHLAAIPTDWLSVGAKYIFACELIYTITMAVVKVSIGGYFLRLSGKRYQKIIIYATLTLVLLYSIMYFLFILLQCRPVAFLWNQFYTENGSCVSHQTLADVTYAHAAISAVTDWILGVLPVTFVWGMKMNPRTKLSVIFILCLGFFASTATIVRIAYIYSLTQTEDYTWEGINLAKWSLVEPAIGITAANIATLRPLFTNFLQFGSGKSKRKSRGDARYSNESQDSGSGFMSSTLRPGSGKQAAYSAEFAKMMGLSEYGVTTTITAGVTGSEKSEGMNWGLGRRKKKAYEPKEVSMDWSTGSQTELHDIEAGQLDTGYAGRPAAGGFDWNAGIKKTTHVVSTTD